MKPKVDSDLCTGCGLCEDTCPEVFKLGDDDLAQVINENPPEELNEKIQECIDDCPAEAISAE